MLIVFVIDAGGAGIAQTAGQPLFSITNVDNKGTDLRFGGAARTAIHSS